MASEGSLVKNMKACLPKPLARFAGFAFLQCWILMLFSSSVVRYGAEAGLPLLELHAIASLMSVATALAILLCTIRLCPLARRKEPGLLMACLGCAGTLGLVCASSNLLPAWCGWAGMAAVAISVPWLYLSWQEYFSTQGARAAICGFACTTVIGAMLFLVLMFLPHVVGAVVSAILPLAADLALRPHRGARFFTRVDRVMTPRELCADIAHDWSPRLMTVVCLVSFVYASLRATGVPLLGESGFDLWLRFAGASSAAALLACWVVLSAKTRSIMKAFYVAIPLSALGVVAVAVPTGWSGEVGMFLGTCAFSLVSSLVWIVMLEKAFSRKLPILGLIASLWMASYTGIFTGQVLAFMWPFGGEFLRYVLLLALVAASLLLVSMNGKLTVSSAVLDAPEQAPVAQRAIEIAETAKLSPRETEILAIWLAGHNASYIEETLHISRNTVKTHLKHIYQKTGVESKEDLLKLGER